MLLWGIHVVRGKRQSVKSCRAFFISDVTGIPEFNIFFKTVENKKKKKRGGLVVARLPSFFLVFSYKQYTSCNFFKVEGNKTNHTGGLIRQLYRCSVLRYWYQPKWFSNMREQWCSADTLLLSFKYCNLLESLWERKDLDLWDKVVYVQIWASYLISFLKEKRN